MVAKGWRDEQFPRHLLHRGKYICLANPHSAKRHDQARFFTLEIGHLPDEVQSATIPGGVWRDQENSTEVSPA